MFIPCILGLSAPKNALKDSATVIILLENSTTSGLSIDSVYLIFDRYDRTGAGVVKKVYYPVNNKLELAVPKGKYFIDVFCLGNCNKHFNRILKAKRNKGIMLRLKTEESSLYTPGLASIPIEKIDFTNLSITSYTSFR
jgi:hypothetical protein